MIAFKNNLLEIRLSLRKEIKKLNEIK